MYRKCIQEQSLAFSSLCQSLLVTIFAFPVESECIICQKNRTNPNVSGYEPQVKNKTKNGSEFLLSYASSFGNDYLSVQLHGLPVTQNLSNEFYFHHICYRNLSRKPKNEADKISQNFLKILKDFIQRHIGQGKVMKVSKLATIYEGYQSSAGVPVKGASKRLVKTKLKKCFE